jgi:hypothetical protein
MVRSEAEEVRRGLGVQGKGAIAPLPLPSRCRRDEWVSLIILSWTDWVRVGLISTAILGLSEKIIAMRSLQRPSPKMMRLGQADKSRGRLPRLDRLNSTKLHVNLAAKCTGEAEDSRSQHHQSSRLRRTCSARNLKVVHADLVTGGVNSELPGNGR